MLKCVCVFVVAENLAMRERYTIHLDSEVDVKVGPAFNYQLNKFQVRSSIRLIKGPIYR